MVSTGYEGTPEETLNAAKEMKSMLMKVFMSDMPGIPKIGVKEISKAIMLGSAGKYGKTYKLTPQEVCSWVWKYIDENGSIPRFDIDNKENNV